MTTMIDPIAKPLLERWIYVLVKVDSAFLAPYTPEARKRIEAEGGYGEAFIPFLRRFLRALQDTRWQAGSYYPGGWYRGLLEAGTVPPEQADITPQALAPFYQEEFWIKSDGSWYVGKKRIEGPVQRFFINNLYFDSDLQRYVIRYRLEFHNETRYLHHESPPYRVLQTVDREGRIELLLNDGTTEVLQPGTLRLDGQERLFCAVKAEGLPAQFGNNARWQLLQQVEERESGWVLCLEQQVLPLMLDAPAEFPGGTCHSDC